MRKVLFILLLLPIFTFGQVGLNNNTVIIDDDTTKITNVFESEGDIVVRGDMEIDGITETFDNRISTLFSGTQYVNIGDVDSLDFDYDEEVSIAFWIKVEASTSAIMIIASKRGGTGAAGWSVRYRTDGGNNKLIYKMINFDNQADKELQVSYDFTALGDGINDGDWHFVLMTYDGDGYGSDCKLYIDNTEKTWTTDDEPLLYTCQTSQNVYIGLYSTFYFRGNLKDLCFFRKVLSSAERTEIYNGGKPYNVKNMSRLVGWYRLGDGDYPSVIFDNSDSKNNGTTVNITGSGNFKIDAP